MQYKSDIEEIDVIFNNCFEQVQERVFTAFPKNALNFKIDSAYPRGSIIFYKHLELIVLDLVSEETYGVILCISIQTSPHIYKLEYSGDNVLSFITGDISYMEGAFIYKFPEVITGETINNFDLELLNLFVSKFIDSVPLIIESINELIRKK